MRTVSKNILKKIYVKRDPWSHKGDFGKVLVIGGSSRYTGSPALTALASLKAGADLVTVVAPERAADIVAGFLPDMITIPLPGKTLGTHHLKDIFDLSQDFDSIVIGGGLGRKDETARAVIKFLETVHKPCVIDADAIHAVSKKTSVIRNKNFVLTPHSYEFMVLTGEDPTSNMDHRSNLVRYFADKLKTTLLLKGRFDVISNGDTTMINKTGTAYMTKGGTGDVLSGVCGAIIARGVSVFDSACAAAFITGKAGEYASKKYGDGMLATDVIEQIPRIIRL
ncbi:MAG: NAD(P)H-hydrate dehydratase [Candidatus Aenigmatarchaeota archaeon]|nr:MAG: NAD(P)H-hydrate dehydratase [Candidatus Aenigmarchaeota archaeon]